MAANNSSYFTARNTVVEYALGDPDADKSTLNWQKIGVNSVNITTSTGTSETQSTCSEDFLANIGNYKDMTFSFEGKAKRADGTSHNLKALFINWATTNNDCYWFRITRPDFTIIDFQLVTSLELPQSDTDTSSYSMSTVRGPVDFNPDVTETP